MDPCPFVRILVGSLALKQPSPSAVHVSNPPFCLIKLNSFPKQTATVLQLAPDQTLDAHQTPSASFNLTQPQIRKLAGSSKQALLTISLYSRRSGSICGIRPGKPLTRVTVPIDLNLVDSNRKPHVFHNGWVNLSGSAQFHSNVRAEPDPRFVFRFGLEPECSPQVFQIQGNIEQPVFTCKFGFRACFDRAGSGPKPSKPAKERKGWSVTIHDLSGSPVAAASMVTPFVPTQGSDRVSRSNPGAWLIIRPCDGAWAPWGRLEAWRERVGCGLGYRFERAGITLTESKLSSRKGGKFTIDDITAKERNTPASSPDSSFDMGSGYWGQGGACKGFMMSCTVGKSGRPEVEVGVDHVTCTEDAAAFVALAAAVDLSVDACQLFTQKLRKELLR